jgi:large conductance mechanosensitive channel
MSFVKEFKEFAMKGNIVDLAVAVVLGGAFGAIVNSLVNNILMPLLGIVTGGTDLTGLEVKVGDAVITYGVFFQSIITFVLIAFALFLAIKGINKMKKQKEEAPAPAVPAAPTKEEVLLAEIRDILKNK